MAFNLRTRFGPPGGEPKPSWMAEDFVFSPADYPSLRGHQLEHEEVDLLEFPLAVNRRVFLSQGSDTLRIEFALCLQGAAAAVDLLFQRAAAFQREPLEQAVVDLARTAGIGDVGFAWAWGDRDGEAGFVRHNVMVFLHGRHETLLQQARELDAALSRQPIAVAQAAREEALFTVAGVLAAAPGGRVDLGAPTSPDERHFFVATGGSVNLDPDQPSRHYYRAGLKPGKYLIEAYRVGRGLLPLHQTLRVDITEARPS